MTENPANKKLIFGEIFTDSAPREIHPLAQLFPLIEGEVLENFSQDLQRNGQIEPIILGPDDSVIDGRNRYLALKRLNSPIKYIRVEGSPKALQELILGRNLHRRHLDVSQRALIGARLKEIYKTEAKTAHEEMAPGEMLPEKVPMQETSKKVAELMSVSENSVYAAEKLLSTATPQIIEAVESGKIKTGAAKLLVPLPPERQKEILESDKKTRNIALKELRKSTTPPPTIRWEKLEEKSGTLIFAFDQESGALTWGKDHPKEYQEKILELLRDSFSEE